MLVTERLGLFRLFTLRDTSCSQEAPPLLVVASGDATVRVWRLTDNTCLHTLTRHTLDVMAVASLGGGRFVSGGCDTILVAWDALAGTRLWEVKTVEGADDDINAIAPLWGGRVATGHESGVVQIWGLPELRGGETVVAARNEAFRGQLTAEGIGTCRALACVPSSKLIASGHSDYVR